MHCLRRQKANEPLFLVDSGPSPPSHDLNRSYSLPPSSTLSFAHCYSSSPSSFPSSSPSSSYCPSTSIQGHYSPHQNILCGVLQKGWDLVFHSTLAKFTTSCPSIVLNWSGCSRRCISGNKSIQASTFLTLMI